MLVIYVRKATKNTPYYKLEYMDFYPYCDITDFQHEERVV